MTAVYRDEWLSYHGHLLYRHPMRAWAASGVVYRGDVKQASCLQFDDHIGERMPVMRPA
jgi:hypothetical protein